MPQTACRYACRTQGLKSEFELSDNGYLKIAECDSDWVHLQTVHLLGFNPVCHRLRGSTNQAVWRFESPDGRRLDIPESLYRRKEAEAFCREIARRIHNGFRFAADPSPDQLAVEIDRLTDDAVLTSEEGAALREYFHLPRPLRPNIGFHHE